ncbi:MAG: NYN domain-containing protein [Oscillospiraceae bacterium]|jgi:uncharacterized LabA/DUF88 family protein|nr:NYN domain-containing protein [Oscillospiraceae bacterium]
MNNLNNLRLAVLIDADNAPRDILKPLMEEIAVYGTPMIKRIYGDWTSTNVGGWKTSLLENAVTPMQQYAYTTGKNSTDSAMIIDAMDVLYAGKTDGFVLVSSDSDFTPLAIRLRESGMYVIGVGEHKTPEPFIKACDKFIYVEVIRERLKNAEDEQKPKNGAKTAAKPSDKAAKNASAKAQEKPASKNVPHKTISLIADSIADLADDDGFCALGALGNLLAKKQPDFDPRSFGSAKLSTMLRNLPRFELEVRPGSDPNSKPMYVKDKQAQ